MSAKSRIERLEREFFPKTDENKKTVTWAEFQFLYWCAVRPSEEFKALPKVIRTQFDTLYKIFKEYMEAYEERTGERIFTPEGKGPEAQAPKTSPKPTPSGSEST